MFPGLPDELNEHILSYFDPRLDKTSLGALCRTNKLGYRLATPIFYEVVGVGQSHGHAREPSLPLQQLCRTLVYNPTLISHIQRLEQYIGHGPASILEVFDIEHCRAMLAQSGLTYKTYGPVLEAIASNSSPSFPAWVALLILLCRQARAIKLRIDWRWSEIDELKHTLYSLATEPNSCAISEVMLDNLCDVEVDGGVSLADVMPIIRLPSLRKLIINGFEGTAESFSLHPPASLHSNLEVLEVEACLTGTDELAPLLAFCPKISSLTIQWPFREENFWRDDWRVLGDSLRRLSDLQHLHIIHTRDRLLTVDRREAVGLAPLEMTQQDVPPLGSLRSISNLKVMTVSDMALFGSAGFHGDFVDGHDQEPVLETLLPKSVRELNVLYHDIYLAGAIRLLPHDPMVPNLDKFTLYNCQQDRWLDKDGVEGFKPVFGPERPPASNIEGQAADLIARLSTMSPGRQLETINEIQNHADTELPFGQAVRVNEMLEHVRHRMGMNSS